MELDKVKQELTQQYTQQTNEASRMKQILYAMEENMVKIVGKIELIDKLIEDETESKKKVPQE